MGRKFAGGGDGRTGSAVQGTGIDTAFEFIQAAGGLADIKGVAKAVGNISKKRIFRIK